LEIMSDLSEPRTHITSHADRDQSNTDWFVARRSRLRTAAMWTAGKTAAGLQNLRGNCEADGFGILMYHRVAPLPAGVPAPTLNVTPDQLRRQLSGLIERGFECWPLTKIVQAHAESRSIPTTAFAITFDDGYENNFIHALPVLRELNCPATIYLATAYLDTDRPFPFDDWRATGSDRIPTDTWRPLSTSQCYELLASGLIEFGAHTHTHQKFVHRCADFRRDMTTCLNILRDRFGESRPTFAFPYGDVNPELIEAARQLDLSCAVLTHHRRVLPGDDLFQWGRFYVGPRDTPAMLAAKLSGWYPKLASACKAVAQPLVSLMSAVRGNSNNGAYERKFRDVALAGKASSQP
jgi:peptidoglycan/xylan/chitin deacetylase (PgdA/CDA1 family)